MTWWILGGFVVALMALGGMGGLALLGLRLSAQLEETPPAPDCPACGAPTRPFTRVSKRGAVIDTWMVRSSRPTHWRCSSCSHATPIAPLAGET